MPGRGRTTTTEVDHRRGAEIAHLIGTMMLADASEVPDRGAFDRRILAALPEDVRAGRREPTPDEELVAFADAITAHRALAYLGFHVPFDTSTAVGRSRIAGEETARNELLKQLVAQRDTVRAFARGSRT